ncbi:DnaJ-like cysteine-rich domain-containing protein [Achromobacter piechaudii]|uniref:Uncharacterized protein n=1 Tax=Achromobacter piechaudii TaxID=72556 RepID=A0ABN7F4V1_9BURK|nr:hypothetical protein [Achromobacter piechaudii]CAB3729220.1 hypothetical protein LMG1873_04654 [Achromobacter piechaudii]
MNTNNGWKLVPVVPTDEMEVAAENDYEQTGATFPRWKSAYAAMLAAAPAAPGSPASTQPIERDWELSCFYCNGSGHVFVKRQVAELATDVQEFKEDCEGCDGRGFTIAFEDIPGIDAYVKSRRPAPASAQEDAKDEQARGRGDVLEVARETGLRSYLHGVNAMEARMLLQRFVDALSAAAPAAGDALDRDQQRLALWQAIRDITIGNLHDDKLILANLHKAGYVIALAAIAQQSQRKEA